MNELIEGILSKQRGWLKGGLQYRDRLIDHFPNFREKQAMLAAFMSSSETSQRGIFIF